MKWICDPTCSWRWIEVGWAEVSWDPNRKDKQIVFVYDTQHNVWHFFDQYILQQGVGYVFSIDYQGNNNWQAYIWWNDAWQPLHTATLPFALAGASEVTYEVLDNTGTHWWTPQVNYPPNILINDPNQPWRLWDSSIPTDLDPVAEVYEGHWNALYYDWYGHRH
jgi:hypothetical protein